VDILPFTFISKYDGQEDVKHLADETWNDNVGGSRAVSLYLKEIMELAVQLLDSPRWNLKHAAARAVAAATEALASGIDGIPKAQAEVIWPALRKALDGKTWNGKEVVVEAFAEFAKSVKDEEVRSKINAEVVKVCALTFVVVTWSNNVLDLAQRSKAPKQAIPTTRNTYLGQDRRRI
jgi:proteasome component ECM29